MKNAQQATERKPTENLLFALWVILGCSLLWLALVQIDIRPQMMMSAAFVILLICLRRFVSKGWSRLAFLFLGGYLALRYILWRTFHTLDYSDPVSLLPALALYAAELYSVTVFFLNIFVNLNPLNRRPVKLSANSLLWPTVDVYVPTYDESNVIIETTLLAAMQIRYPKDKFRVYLLDDGGTLEKRNHSDPVRAAAALERYNTLQAYCTKIGAHYLTREKNDHAKAGNLNSALKQTHGDLILTLDTDHVPTIDILEKTVGWFERDPKLFLVQTPHFFINPDPVERNLGTFQKMPSENEMFYNVIQKGLDFWNASFFCGSAAVLRRSHLEAVGGIAGETVTEDAETALSLHARGYHSAYLAIPMISGLSPETFSGLVIQRVRWAQGMIQILLLKNPFRIKGLSAGQRLCYFSNCFFWFFAFARVVFLLAPVAYLVFGLQIYKANSAEFFAYAVPHLFAAILVSDYLFGKVRWSFVSELYELLQSVYCLRAIFAVIRKPRSIRFNVTPKGEHLEEDFISPLIVPLYVFMTLTVAAIIGAGCRLALDPHSEQTYAVLITLGWSLFNAMLLLASMGALFEHRQRRASPRVTQGFSARLLGGLNALKGEVVDLSVGGIGLLLDPSNTRGLKAGAETMLCVESPLSQTEHDFHVVVRNQRMQGDKLFVGLEFIHTSIAEVADKIKLVLGDSDRWIGFQRGREQRIGVWRSLFFLIKLGFVFLKHHLHFFRDQYRQKLTRRPLSPAEAASLKMPIAASTI
jgi:cellulose synthase (UDP-forming)